MKTIGMTPEMVSAALVCGAVSLLVYRRFLSWSASMAVSAIKVFVPLFYFAYAYDGTWQMVDDVLYYDFGVKILAAGYNPLTVFTNRIARSMLLEASQGPVLLYWWWNVFAEWLFGMHYYAPVFVNLVAGAVTGLYVFKLVRFAGFTAAYARVAAVFTVLHWDVLTWTSFLNLKDGFVILFSAMSLHYLLQLTRGGLVRATSALVKLIASLVLLAMVRFYAGVLIMIAYAIWLLLKRQRAMMFVLWGIAAAALLWFIRPYLGQYGMITLSVPNFVFGFIHFLLTPQPWSVEPNYSFVTIPAVLHWLFFVPALIGMTMLWRSSSDARLLLLYLALITAFYAVVPDLQGPRQRLQVSFIWAWMELHFLYMILTPVRARRTPEGEPA